MRSFENRLAYEALQTAVTADPPSQRKSVHFSLCIDFLEIVANDQIVMVIVANFFSRRPEFNLILVNIVFVVGKLARKQNFLGELGVPYPNTIPANVRVSHVSSSASARGRIAFTVQEI
jgi:hypothetical protein